MTQIISIISDCDENIQSITDPNHCINLGGDSLYDIYIKNLVANEYELEYGWNYGSNGDIEGT